MKTTIEKREINELQKIRRNSAARKALFTSILTSFFRYGRIETTEAKAKELRKFAEQLITLAKRGDLNARRKAIASLADEDVVRKLFDEIAAKYADRQGGYTRIQARCSSWRRCSDGYHRARLIATLKAISPSLRTGTFFIDC